MRKIIYFIVASLISLMMQAQTVLVNPNAEGGFELGTDFAANGWTVDNGAQTNQWFVGTVPLSPNNNAAYISNDFGTSWNYTNTSTSVVHFYRDITFPAGETDIQLSFWIKGIGESSFDRLRVYLVPTTTTPVAGTELSSGQVGQANYSLQNEWIKVGIQIPASAAGTTQRLVFSWRNDNSLGTNLPIAIDNISLISQVPYNLSGTYTIDNSLPTGGLNFNGFVDAILTLNSATITGPVDFIVTSGQQFTEILPVITATGTAANTITFAKSGVAYPKILSSGFNTTTDAIIALRGGDYFTFNGLELGLLVPIHNQLEYGIYVFNENATNGAQNNIFNDIIISLNRAYTSSRAVYQNVATTPSDVTGANSYNTYNAINVSNSYNGIVITGNATYPDLGLTVQNCIIGSDNPNDIGFGTSAISGLRITSGRDVVVANNIVRNLTITGGANLFGLFMENIQGTSEIYNNKVYNLTSTSTSTSAVLTGLRADVTSTNTANVYNNVVYGFNHAIASPSATNVARGMVANLSGAGTVNLAYNSVNIALNANASNDALRIGGGTVNLVNNVLVNSSASGSTSNRYCIYRSGGTIISDYNNIYIPSGTNNYIGYYTSNQTTMTDWQAAVSGDANSISVDPLFTGTPDLMPSNPAMNNLGTTVPGITTDILGVARNATNPDMGAYEFNPPTCVMPTDLTVSGITTNSAILGWTSSASEWNIEVGLPGFTPGNSEYVVSIYGSVANPTPATGLTHSTQYQFYVQSVCGIETSSWAGPVSFSTLCGTITSFPYTESFDGTTFAPTCWTNQKTAGSGTGLWDRQTSGSNPTCTPHSGAGMARFNCFNYSSGTAGILVTPEISAPANHIVEFWMYRDNGYSSDLDRVNVYTNATPDLTGATLLGTINRSITQTPVEASNGWYKYKYDLPAGNQYIIFEGISAYGNNIFIDDITIKEKPTSTVTWCNLQWPGNFTMTTNENVEIYAQVYEAGITDAIGQGAGIEAWIGYSTANTNPSTWTNWIPAIYNVDVGNNDEYKITLGSLAPGTYYYASRFSLNEGPYSYGGFNGGFWDGTNNVSGVLTVNAILGSHCDNPYIVQIPADLTYAQSHTTCGMSNYYDLSSTSYDNGEDAIYRLDVTQNTVVKITMTPVETYSGLFLFDGCPDTGTLIQSVTNSEATPRIIIEALTVGTYYVMVDTWPSPNCTDYSIQIEVVCPAPTGITATNITTSQADLSWTAGGFETSWNVKVSSTAIDPTAETGDIYDGIVNSLPLQLTGLTESTTYYVYVQAACASTWTNGTFTTADACPVPTNLTATTGINDANLSWSSFTGDSWNLKVSSTPIDPSTETADIVDINLSSTSYNVSGLNSNTTYYWYVQTVCTVPAESNWSGQATFTTQCGIFNLPFAEDFESGMLNCWTILNVDGGLPVWTLNTSQNHTPGGNTSIYHNYNGANSDDGWLITPAIQLPTNQNINLSFWSYNSFPTWYGENSVWVSTTGTDPSDFTKIWQPSSVTASWEQTNLDLSSYAGEIVYVAFRYAGYDAHAWYLDDINITATPIIVNQINQIDINNDVVDVQVCLGTSEVEAISLLANQITITDTEDNQYIVDLTWTVASYDANTAGDYTATGTFELPAGVNQTDPPTALEVTATITVNELPVVTCPEDFILTTNSIVTLTGENPTGGVYSGTGVSGYIFNPDGLDNGDYTITYTYTDPVTGCVNSCNFTITLDIDVNVSAQTISAISIYPNPNNGKFSVVFNNFEGKVTYGIYDAKGSVIITEEVYTSGNTVRDFDIKLVPGVYYIKMTNDSNTFVEKIVIQ
ncbi:MAG TPA: choice-of-anchor J domain-containing protein [Bacteroidales bacterium]|nr:choice-of-anchor J domain-containing protein [Bacteroidales bacterium]HPD24829.1 choice-of-anchor J domain-containing protein [Bacteroidales bacterium]HRS99569.1 choice-of-anchor J domain-containing protein [Bacteroidales bacterium]HRT80423.1 choice-of-anchor J domain-containing protein [Bacteroidales bacterium]